MVLPYFEQSELYQNPFLDRRHSLDRQQFKPVMDQFYSLHGWAVENGWPTRGRLRELDQENLYRPMVDGATSARERHRSR